MKTSTLKTRIQNLRDSSDCCDLAADLYGTDQNCEGNLAECFVAGWVNAMDCIEEGSIDRDDENEFLRICLNEVNNCYPETLNK